MLEKAAKTGMDAKALQGMMQDSFLTRVGTLLPEGNLRAHRQAAMKAYNAMGTAGQFALDELALAVRADTYHEMKGANQIQRAKRGLAQEVEAEAHYQKQVAAADQKLQTIQKEAEPLQAAHTLYTKTQEEAFKNKPNLKILNDKEIEYDGLLQASRQADINQKKAVAAQKALQEKAKQGRLENGKMDPKELAEQQAALQSAREAADLAKSDANIKLMEAQEFRKKLLKEFPEHAEDLANIRQMQQNIDKAKAALDAHTSKSQPVVEQLNGLKKLAAKNGTRATATKLYWTQAMEKLNAARAAGNHMELQGDTSTKLGILSRMVEVDELGELPSQAANYHYAIGAYEASERSAFVDKAVGDMPELWKRHHEANIFAQDAVTPTQLRGFADAIDGLEVNKDIVDKLRDTADVMEKMNNNANQLVGKQMKINAEDEIRRALAGPPPDEMFGPSGSFLSKPDSQVAAAQNEIVSGTKSFIQRGAAQEWFEGPLKKKAAKAPDIGLAEQAENVLRARPTLSQIRLANVSDRHGFNDMVKQSMREQASAAAAPPTQVRLESLGMLKPETDQEKAIDQMTNEFLDMVATTQQQKDAVFNGVASLFRNSGDHPSKLGAMTKLVGAVQSQTRAGKTLATTLAEQVGIDLDDAYSAFKVRNKAQAKTMESQLEGGPVAKGSGAEAAKPYSYNEFQSKILDMVYEASPERMKAFIKEFPEARQAIRTMLKFTQLGEQLKLMSPDLQSGNLLETYFPMMYTRFSKLRADQGGNFSDPEIAKLYGTLNSEKERFFKTPSEAMKNHRDALSLLGLRPSKEGYLQRVSDSRAGAGQRDEKFWLNFLKKDRAEQIAYIRKVNQGKSIANLPDDQFDDVLAKVKRGLLVGEPISDIPTLMKAHVGQVFKADAQRFFLRSARSLETDIGGKMMPILGTKEELGAYAKGSTVEYEGFFGEIPMKKSGMYDRIDSRLAKSLDLDTMGESGLYMHPMLKEFMDANNHWSVYAQDGDSEIVDAFKGFIRGLKGAPLTGPAGPFRAQIYNNFMEFFNGNILQLSSARQLGHSMRFENTQLRFQAELSGVNFSNWRQMAYGVANEMTEKTQALWKKTAGDMTPEELARWERQYPDEAREYYAIRADVEEKGSTTGRAAAIADAEANKASQQASMRSTLGGAMAKGAAGALNIASALPKALLSLDGYVQNRALFDDLNDVAVGAWMLKRDQLKMSDLPRMLAEGKDYDTAMRDISETAAQMVNARAGTVAPHLKSKELAAAFDLMMQTPSYAYTRMKDMGNAITYLPRKFMQDVERESGLQFPKALTRNMGTQHIAPAMRAQYEKEMAWNVLNGTVNAYLCMNALNYLVNGTSTADLGQGNEQQMEVNGVRVSSSMFNYVKPMGELLALPTIFRTAGVADMIVDPSRTSSTTPSGKSHKASETSPWNTMAGGKGNGMKRAAVEAGTRTLQTMYNQGTWLSEFFQPQLVNDGSKEPLGFIQKNVGAIRDTGAVGASAMKLGLEASGLSEKGSAVDNVLTKLSTDPNTNITMGFVESYLKTLGVTQRHDMRGTFMEPIDKIQKESKGDANKFMDSYAKKHLTDLGRQYKDIKKRYDEGSPAYMEAMARHQADRDRLVDTLRGYNEQTGELIDLPGARYHDRHIVQKDEMAPDFMNRAAFDDAELDNYWRMYYLGEGTTEAFEKIDKNSREKVWEKLNERETVRGRRP
jgi:hypothetical protein